MRGRSRRTEWRREARQKEDKVGDGKGCERKKKQETEGEQKDGGGGI